MDTFIKYLPLALLLTACGSLRETGQVRDDVYDIPDRTAVASVSSTPEEKPAPAASDGNDYYDAGEARDAGVYRDYYDMTYNDPYYYNTGRFGFGASVNSWGPGYGMGMSYGWPTSWGSMSIGYGMGMGWSPYWGYNPYWGNSWMSGYGYGDPWGYYGYGNYGYGYGYGSGWSPYRSPWGPCFGCYEPVGYGNVVYGHRPSMNGSATTSGTARPPVRSYRNPAGLIQTPLESSRPGLSRQQGRMEMPSNTGRTPSIGTRPSRSQTTRESRPARNSTWNFGGGDAPSRSGGGDSSPSRSGGGGGGGGRTSSPRPR